jgi:acyl-CoA thioesterase-2
VFGGQVLAQALHAATRTVPEDRLVHSLHSYFILPGDVSKPIIYIVARTRDGGSFTTRRVRAVQNGRDIFVLACSFQLNQEGLDHQMNMPEVPGPEDLPTDVEMVKAFADLIPEKFRRFTEDKPLVFKPVEIPDFLSPVENKPFQHVWLKAKGELPDDQAIQRTVLAYASDYNLLYTALRPHAVVLGEMQLASLDHAMWFHRDFHLNDWLLYALDSPSASNARGFTRGKVFDRQGRLVASVAQEGMIRKKRKRK